MDIAQTAAGPHDSRAPLRHGSAGKTLADLLNLLGVVRAEDSEALEFAARFDVGFRRVAAGESLIEMGAPVHSMYFVHTGTFKIARSDPEGYEQVLAFAGRGEALGYDALCAQSHPTGAIALEDSTVYAIDMPQATALR